LDWNYHVWKTKEEVSKRGNNLSAGEGILRYFETSTLIFFSFSSSFANNWLVFQKTSGGGRKETEVDMILNALSQGSHVFRHIGQPPSE
jgi:hypothetical protein